MISSLNNLYLDTLRESSFAIFMQSVSFTVGQRSICPYSSLPGTLKSCAHPLHATCRPYEEDEVELF